MLRRLLLCSFLLVAGRSASAQTADTWLRDALSPPTPASHKLPSLAIYPEQTIPLTFSHTVHTKAGVECESCHDMVGDSKSAVDRNIPAHPQCETCHDIEAASKGETTDPVSTCETCHPGIVGKKTVPKNVIEANNITFSHQAHLRRGAKCTDCHAGVQLTELATRENLPRMTTCLNCHDGTKAPNKCSECHLTEPDGVLRTRFASGTLAPSGTLRDDDHGRDFLKRHAAIAQADSESCTACHRVAECETCHASTSKAFRVHPPEWVQTHGIAVRSQQMDCTSCHREQSFCVSCHQQSGVSFEGGPRGPAGNPALIAKKFHPPGFASLSVTGPNHHSFEAAANPESCVGCHDQKTCMACHATSNVVTPSATHPGNVDPHPPGFATSTAACRAFKMAPFACAPCHGAASPMNSAASLLIGCK